MKLVVISGSRNADGQTARAASAFVRGAEAAGAQSEVFYLPKLDIQHCRQCEDSGWGLCIKEGRCVAQDDFSMLVAKIIDADAVAFATPVYWSDLSESLKSFLDRLRRICWHENGEKGLQGKRAVGICVAGGGGGGAPTCCVSLEKILHTCGMDMIDMIPARRQNLEMKLDVCETVGRWIVESSAD